MTEIEDKLDEDFLYYLGFTNTFLENVDNPIILARSRAWLDKLCGEQCPNVQTKRYRNIYLSNLLLCMQEGKLSQPFQVLPALADISDALEVFGHPKSSSIDSDFLKELAKGAEEDLIPRDGRTYLATRTLPNGQGAFAYIAVTLAEDEPKWLGCGESLFQMMNQNLDQQYLKMPQSVAVKSTTPEIEQALRSRSDPSEREKVLAFYDTVLANINNEIEEEVKPEDNVAINGLIEQLVADLKQKDTYKEYEDMSEKHRRMELLLALHERVYARRNKIAQRESLLDDVEHETLPPSLFDLSVQMQDKIELPAAMWEQAINKIPNTKCMGLLSENYPIVLIEKFLDLLSNEKEEIALRIQKRHENIVSQMRKELRKEAEREKLKTDEVEKQFEKVTEVVDAIKTAYKAQQDAVNALKKEKTAAVGDQAHVYAQLKAILYYTQLNVEEEAERGRELKDQINSVNAQTELLLQLNDDTIRKVEASNVTLMKNIKRLRNAVKQNEFRVTQLQSISKSQKKRSS